MITFPRGQFKKFTLIIYINYLH